MSSIQGTLSDGSHGVAPLQALQYLKTNVHAVQQTIRHQVRLDQMLVPTFHRAWAPKGETPFIETQLSTDPVAVISVLAHAPNTGDCELYFRSQQDYFDGDAVFRLFRDMAEFLPRNVMFILDNLPVYFPTVAQLEGAFAETATLVAVKWVSYVRSRTQSQ